MNSPALRVLIVDDEPLARLRLRTLLQEVQPACEVAGEAADADEALCALQAGGADVVLLDIRMPGPNPASAGLRLAAALKALPQPPAVIFVTAHAEHAVKAFELQALDYLTKPVRKDRLAAALARVPRAQGVAAEPGNEAPVLVLADRGRLLRLPLAEVLYFKAEQKYVTVRTATRSYIMDGSLSELETKFAPRFLRIHRNALVARRAVRALEKHYDPDEGEGWAVRLQGLTELLMVSRRQVAAVREELAG